MSRLFSSERNAIERTKALILLCILVLSAVGEACLVSLDLSRDRDISNNLGILAFLCLAFVALFHGRKILAAYLLLTPFAVDFIRATLADGADTHALPLLFLLIVEIVYFLPTRHALLFVGAVLIGFNAAAYAGTAPAEVSHAARILVVANAIAIGITAIFTTVFVSMKRYFNQMEEQNEHLDELVHERTNELDKERRRSEQLLQNILPIPIIERIKKGESAPVDRIEDASVLFADLTDFTSLSGTMSADELVALLNQVFSAMDRLAERHGLEKIKTIGDAYMVAAGVPKESDDGLERLANFALDVRVMLADLNAGSRIPLNLRMGINTGPVVAGVIGNQKLMYDLWGETVNIASRMESHGKPGQIQSTEAVYERLKDRFAFVPRGPVMIAGAGRMNTWFLESRRGVAANGSAADHPALQAEAGNVVVASR